MPTLVSVIPSWTRWSPTGTLPNCTVSGFHTSWAISPVPVSAELVAWPIAGTTFSRPSRAPPATGLNTTPTAQGLPGATPPVQPLVWMVNSRGLPMPRVTDVEQVDSTMKVKTVEAEPTATEPKSCRGGRTVTSHAGVTQLPWPLHIAGVTQARAGTLSCCPAGMATQVPPAPVHDWQTAQVCTQQRPSTQLPAPHVGAPSPHVSPGPGGQSVSVARVHMLGQKLSPFWQGRGMTAQAKVQASALPRGVRMVLASPTQARTSSARHGSQVSPDSTRPLPQPAQSRSWVGPQLGGQKLSAGPHIRGVSWQVKRQVSGSPMGVRMVLASLTQARARCSHTETGSQVSPDPASRCRSRRSRRRGVGVQPAGQLESTGPQGRGVSVQVKVQVAGSPPGVRSVL